MWKEEDQGPTENISESPPTKAIDSASIGIKATGTGNDNDGIGVENTDTDMIVQALAVLALILTFWQYWTDILIITGTDMFHIKVKETHM